MAWRYQCEFCNGDIEDGDEVSVLGQLGYYISCFPCSENFEGPLSPITDFDRKIG